MTPSVVQARTAALEEAPATRDVDTPDHRDGPGHLRVDPRVVRKLAEQAANEVDGVSQASVGPIGRAIHHPVPASTPIDQLGVDVDLAVSIDYPLAVRVVAERLAAHVTRRVEELAGRPVRRLNVHVENLGASQPSARPKVH